MEPRARTRARLHVVGNAARARPAAVVPLAPPAPEVPDAVLVERVRAGHAASREALYLRHVDYIAGMCVRILRSVDAGEDVVQDTFVLAFDRLGSLREPGAFRGWLASIAISQVHRHLSRRRLLRVLGLDRAFEEAPLDELAREDSSAEIRSELAALDYALKGLPANQRIAWMLRHVEGESLEAVAASCGCSLATAKRWLTQAHEQVQRHVEFILEEAP